MSTSLRSRRQRPPVLGALGASAVLAAIALAGILGVPAPLLAVGCVAAAVWIGCVASTSALTWFAASAVGCSVLATVVWPDPRGPALQFVTCGLILALVAVPVRGIVALTTLRREYRRRGWELADLTQRDRDRAIAEAVSQERSRMALEVHDRVGHQLTLVGVGLGALEVDARLDAAHRAQVAQLREGLADATEEVSETVALLRREGDNLRRDSWDVALADIVDRARLQGIEITASLPEKVIAGLGPATRSALSRVLTEAVTNSAKHAPGAPITLALEQQAGQVRLRVSNPSSTTSASEGGGSGLVGLDERVRLLGGSQDVARGNPFVLSVTLPLDARRSFSARPDRLPARFDAAVRKQQRSTWWWMVSTCTALVLGATACLGGFFAYANVVGVLSPRAAASLQVGAPMAEVEKALPPVEMLDAPRSTSPEPVGATCTYYESAVSFFDRVDVIRVCSRAGVLVAVDTIPAR